MSKPNSYVGCSTVRRLNLHQITLLPKEFKLQAENLSEVELQGPDRTDELVLTKAARYTTPD